MIVAAVLGGLALPAFAGPAQGDVSFSLLGGVDTPLRGVLHKGATAVVPDLGPLNPDLAGVDAELRIGSRERSEIYDMAITRRAVEADRRGEHPRLSASAGD